MKLIEKTQHRYKVLKPFLFEKRTVEVGEEISMSDETSAIDLVAAGKLLPLSIPPLGKYKALSSFNFQVGEKLVEIKCHEILEVQAKDAVKLMLERKIYPLSEDVWRPFQLRERRQTVTESIRIGRNTVDMDRPVEKPLKPKKPFISSWRE